VKRRALGKGLGALIPERPAGPANKILTIPLGQIKPGIQQPRSIFDPDKINELAESIKANGVIHPVVLRPVPTGYELIAGERRWRAAKLAGLDQIPAIIRNMNDKQALEVSLIENLQRHDLNPVEAAMGYKLLIDQYGLKQEDVAKIIGKKRATISNSLRLLKLPPDILELVKEEKLTAGHAKALLSLNSPDDMTRFSDTTIKFGWSVRKLEGEVARHLEVLPVKPPEPVEDPNLFAALDSLKKRYSTQIKCVPRQSGGGRLILEYYDNSDLIRIIQLLGK